MRWRFSLGSLLMFITALSMVGGLISPFMPQDARFLVGVLVAPIVVIGIGLLVTLPIWPLFLAAILFAEWKKCRKSRASYRAGASDSFANNDAGCDV